MRKLFLLCALVGATAMVSCKKDHECTCKSTSLNGGEQKWSYESSSKKNAEDACNSQQSVLRTQDPDATCELD